MASLTTASPDALRRRKKTPHRMRDADGAGPVGSQTRLFMKEKLRTENDKDLEVPVPIHNQMTDVSDYGRGRSDVGY